MRILKNTLEPLVETWGDPGMYPNALAAGPLPSYDYFAGVEGELTVELTPEELTDYADCPEDFIENGDEITEALPRGVSCVKWGRTLAGNVLTLEVLDCEGEYEAPEPDWDSEREAKEERLLDDGRDSW